MGKCGHFIEQGRAANATKCLPCASGAIPEGGPRKRKQYRRWMHGRHNSIGA